jgi:hypothetical protein
MDLRMKFLAIMIILFSSMQAKADPLLIAPMLEGLHTCRAAVAAGQALDQASSEVTCARSGQSAAPFIRDLLDGIGPEKSASGRYELGYTLTVSILDAYRRRGEKWEIDRKKIAHDLSPILELDRPVVVYLHANHFAIELNKELLAYLSSDAANLMWSVKGPMKPEKYFSADIIPWSISNLNGSLDQFRRDAFAAYIETLCALPNDARNRIRAISVLGETHQMWPDFAAGMGYERRFLPTDYSPPSIAAFRFWLRERFGTISRLNALVRASYSSFGAVSPPSRDIHDGHLNSFQEHLDTFAGGIVPVIGWAHSIDREPIEILIYLDGALQASVPARANRLDVAEAKPEFGTPLVGFRFDMDYSRFSPGIHTLEILAQSPDRKPVRLARQSLVIVDRQDLPTGSVTSYTAPEADERSSWPRLEAVLDHPKPSTSLFFNPLARLWSEFRSIQVRTYIQGFADIAASSCFQRDQIFSHQLTPRFYGSWNSELMAVDASLEPNMHYQTGITLYGGAAWSEEVFDWLASSGRRRYSIGELNPKVPLTEDALTAMLDRHRRAGAVYLAPYYMRLGRPEVRPSNADYERFLIDPTAPTPEGKAFFRALQSTMQH